MSEWHISLYITCLDIIEIQNLVTESTSVYFLSSTLNQILFVIFNYHEILLSHSIHLSTPTLSPLYIIVLYLRSV